MKPELEPAPLHTEPPSRGWRLPLIVAALLGLGVLSGILWLGRPNSDTAAPPVPAQLPPLTPEAEAYLAHIEIGELHLSRWGNFLGQRVTYVDFTLTNRGTRTLVAVELTVEFLDPYQAVVLRETLRPIGATHRPSLPGRPTGPLAAGESRNVRASFEHIPADWNRLPPQTRITGLLLR